MSRELLTSIYPFILRGVSLHGIDSVQCDMETRLEILNHLANDWKTDKANETIVGVSLEDLGGKIDQMLKGKHTGRTIVNLEL